MNIYAHVFHIVHIEDFYTILKKEKLLNRHVSEEHIELKNIGLKATWFSPIIFGQKGSFYGNIGFCIDFFDKFWKVSEFKFYFYQETSYNSETKVYRYLISRKDYSEHTFLKEIQKKNIKKGSCMWWIGHDKNIVSDQPRYPNKNIIEFIIDEEVSISDYDGVIFLNHSLKCVKELANMQKCNEKGKTFQQAQKQVLFELIIKKISLGKLKLLRKDESSNETTNIISEEVIIHPSRYSDKFNTSNLICKEQAENLIAELLQHYLDKKEVEVNNILKMFNSIEEFEKYFFEVFEKHYQIKVNKLP